MELCRLSDIDSSDSDYMKYPLVEDDWHKAKKSLPNLKPHSVSSHYPVVCCNINSYVNSVTIKPTSIKQSCFSDSRISDQDVSPSVKKFMANFMKINIRDESLSDSLSEGTPCPATSKGYHSDGARASRLPPIGVFWDIENCQVPKGKSAVAVAQAIRNKFFHGYREAEFVIVCDVRKEHSIIIDELNDAQVNLIHVGSTSKNAADEKLRQSMRRFADLHGFPAAIVLITGDINFAPDINDIRHRKKIRVILLHNDMTSESLLLCANENYHFYTLLEEIPKRGTVKAGMYPVYLAVRNLPTEYEVRRIKQRLKALTGNCGGRVFSVDPPVAIIRFPSMTYAHRAQKRLEGECVFGNPISVGFPQRSSYPISENMAYSTGGHMNNYMDLSMGVPPPWFHPASIYSIYGGSRNGCFSSGTRSPWYPYQPGGVTRIPVINVNTSYAREDNHGSDQNSFNMSQLFSMKEINSEIGKTNPQRVSPVSQVQTKKSLDSCKGSLNVERQQEERKHQTPSPYTVNPPNSHRYFNPITTLNGQTSSLVELNITNLDQRILPVEMKKTLTKLFSEHVAVRHFSIYIQSDGNFAAVLKVSTLQDAQLIIAKFHRVKIGHKRIIISYAHTGHPHDPHFIRGQIVSLLREVPGYKLPLFKFLEMFESRFMTNISISELHRLKDVVTIVNDSSGRLLYLNQQHRNSPSPIYSQKVEAFCVVHYKGGGNSGWAEQELPPLPRVNVHLAEFRENVNRLVTIHNDALPLSSIQDCYTAEFGSLPTSKEGVAVEHLVTCISTVELVQNSALIKYLKPFRPSSPLVEEGLSKVVVNPTLQNDLQLFGREVVDLLRTQPQSQLPFPKFIPAYHHYFGRQCRVANYGFTKLIELLEAIPNIVQVMGEGSKRVVTLSHRAQMRRFTSDVLRVVKSQPLMQATASELPYLFEKVLGHSLDPTSYGLCFIEDLIEELPKNIVSVTTVDSDQILAIPKRQRAHSETQRTLDFSKEVVELLSLAQHCSILFNKFIPAYHHHFGYQCRVADFGFTKLIELFEAIPEIIEIDEASDGEKRLSLTLKEKFRVLNQQIESLVGVRYPPGLPLSFLPAAYLWQYGHALKPSVFQAGSLRHLVSSLDTVKIIDTEWGETLVPMDESMLHLLEQQVRWVLMDSPTGKVSLSSLNQTFNKCFHEHLTITALPQLMHNTIKIEKEEGREVVGLCGAEEEARKVYLLLRDVPEARMPLNALLEAYLKQYGHPMPSHSYSSPTALLLSLSHTIKIRGKEPRKIVYLNRDMLRGIGTKRNVLQKGVPGFLFEMNFNDTDENKEESPMASPPKWPTIWNNGLNANEFENQTPIVNLPKMATPPANIVVDSSLISPCKGLLPATMHPMLVAPHPSQLPIPNEICDTAKDSPENGYLKQTPQRKESKLPTTSTKRKLKLAAHFQSPLDQ